MRSDSDLHEPRTNAEQSETGDDLRVSYESRRNGLAYVYFVGGDCECVKIGFAKDPAKRLRSLQVGSPVPLFLLASVRGTVEHEKEYHRQFKESWSHGEWFRKTPKLLALIDALVRERNHQRSLRGLPND